MAQGIQLVVPGQRELLEGEGRDEGRREDGALVVPRDDARIERIARSHISVLIQGETGAGKEVLARRIHEQSTRRGKPLVAVNCAAFCATLIESELFGHQRGAFTGADHNKAGFIEAADGGTLFLDEVGELSIDAQAKLLRVLEARQVMRVGAVSPRPVDVRFIAATNVDLDAATATGRFRADLLYRLEGIRLYVSPLRERPDEVVPAAVRFLESIIRGAGQPVPVLTSAAESALRRHRWKGNFRELRNVMERAAVICTEGRIEPADLMLPEPARPAPTPTPTSTSVFPVPNRRAVAHDDDHARERIIEALNECAGNQTRAARLLGISRRTLITRLETFGLTRPRPRTPALGVRPAAQA
jgi:two-component system response regulator AtoC